MATLVTILASVMGYLIAGALVLWMALAIRTDRAIGLADSLLGIDSLLARLRAQEATVTEQLARKVP